MSGISRFDFFRMLLPGGLVLFLIDVSLRILGANAIWGYEVADALTVIEDPFIGIVLSFAIGLLLYWIDIPYATAFYFQDIPSTHLAKRLTEDERGRVHEVSLFFRVSDELMPQELHERALFYGAFYRIGYQTVLFTMLAAVLLPPTLLQKLTNVQYKTVDWSRPEVWAVVSGTGFFATLSVVRWLFRGRKADLKPLIGLGALSFVTVALWLDRVAWQRLPEKLGRPAVLIASISLLFSWVVVRTLGPLGDRWKSWRGNLKREEAGSPIRPERPYRSSTSVFLDVFMASTGAVGLIVISDALSPAQMLGIATLSWSALALSFNRKYERQHSAIYTNQNAWIDSNMHAIRALIPHSERDHFLTDAESGDQGRIGTNKRRLFCRVLQALCRE